MKKKKRRVLSVIAFDELSAAVIYGSSQVSHQQIKIKKNHLNRR